MHPAWPGANVLLQEELDEVKTAETPFQRILALNGLLGRVIGDLKCNAGAEHAQEALLTMMKHVAGGGSA